MNHIKSIGRYSMTHIFLRPEGTIRLDFKPALGLIHYYVDNKFIAAFTVKYHTRKGQAWFKEEYGVTIY